MTAPYVSKFRKNTKAPPKPPVDEETVSTSRLGDLLIRNEIAELIAEELGRKPKSKRSEDLVPLIEEILGYGIPDRFCTTIQKAYKWAIMELMDTGKFLPDMDAYVAWIQEPEVKFVQATRKQLKNGQDHGDDND
jgi:hypothetical protein